MATATVRKVVFLDVDGVLNCKKSRKMRFDAESGIMLLNDLPAAELMDNLMMLVEQTQCDIVLSSTWRLKGDKIEELRCAFEEKGLTIVGVTPDLSGSKGSTRVDEILSWLEDECMDATRTPTKAWLAIDDMDLQRGNDGLKDINFVHTDNVDGLTFSKAEEAVNKLNEQAAYLAVELGTGTRTIGDEDQLRHF